MRVPRVGRKKAEQIILDLADKMDTVGSAPTATGVAASPVADDAIRALIALGYNQLEADRAVRGVMDGGAGGDVGAVVRGALGRLTAK
jgi:Holliday junction DNA helicase RuvA